jgi:hypothetical protein
MAAWPFSAVSRTDFLALRGGLGNDLPNEKLEQELPFRISTQIAEFLDFSR